MQSSILTETQRAVLEQVGKNDFLAHTFYLTGGTALAGFYLHHRYSEDLDFFSEQEFDLLNVDIAIRHMQKALGIVSVDYQQNFNRNIFFLDFSETVLKIEFTFFPFARIEKGKHEGGVAIDSLRDIAVNKLFTVYQRTQARDYVDLYCICQETGWTIAELVADAKNKFDFYIDPIQLGTQFVKAEAAQDYPRMVKELEPSVWKDFFLIQAKKLKPQILS